MSVIFNLDGTETYVDPVFDLQKDLADKIELHKSHLNSGLEELRTYRDDELVTSDWTQVPDGPLDSTTKAAWATYRTKLRDLPGDAKAPYWFEEADWPIAPGASAINPEALGFIKNNDDPLGIATTSWVGITTTMVEKGSLTVNSSGPVGAGTDIVGIADTTGVEVGDTVSYNSQTVGIVAGITTVNISLASTSPVEIESSLEYFREGNIYYAQDRPELTYAVSAGATTIASEGSVKFTITLTNQISEQLVNWQTEGCLNSLGSLEIIPVGTTGIATVNITAPLITIPDNLSFTLSTGISTSVGVTTT